MTPHTIFRYNKKQQNQYYTRTGISVDIQNIGKNTELIAVKEKESVQQITPGVKLVTKVLTFSDGSFSNVYDLSWDPTYSNLLPVIHSSNKSYSLHDTMQDDENKIAIINGSFFFLTDVSDSTPKDLIYNLCIREGKIIGLPSEDQPIVYIANKKLHAVTPKPRGTMKIGSHRFSWVGAKSLSNSTKSGAAVLYNSRCSEIMKVRDSRTNVQIGILDNKHITTPKAKDVYDLVITADKKGNLIVSQINEKGGTHYFAGNFILQMKGKNSEFVVGDSLTDVTLDGLVLDTMTSAISIGKKINDPFFFEPANINRRDARSVIAEDINGHLHFIVFDGSKYIPGFTGVSAKMIKSYFSKKYFAWAYFLDGGGSSRLIVREKADLHVLANLFAFRKFDELHLWDWKFARKVASSISLSHV